MKRLPATTVVMKPLPVEEEALECWIDNVIVPALVKEYFAAAEPATKVELAA